MGLGGPSTISQLMCETKQKIGFVSTVYRRLKVKDRWDVVDSKGKSGGLLVFWGEHVKVYKVIKSDYCIEVDVEGAGDEGRCWVIFLYASTDSNIRKEQWEMLKEKRKTWGKRWILGGNFNEIVSQEDKQGGNQRMATSFTPFREFIREMDMGEVSFCGRRWTWANNRSGEGFIEERLDMFFGSPEWLLMFDLAVVQHIMTQSSDHSVILLDTACT